MIHRTHDGNIAAPHHVQVEVHSKYSGKRGNNMKNTSRKRNEFELQCSERLSA
jgi:hypothetical protein